nr:DUF1566 domain-containing protein [uncultured Draconibacterium sp.]
MGKGYVDKRLGMYRDAGGAGELSPPPGFDSWEEYISYLINQNFPLPDQFNTWQDFVDWLTQNITNLPDGYTSWEEFIQNLIAQNFPLPDQFTTWQDFVDWLIANNIDLPDGYNSWEEYIQYLIDNGVLPDQFNTWQDFIDWLTQNITDLPDGYTSWEEFIQNLIAQNFPLPDQFTTWEQFIDWLIDNSVALPDSFDSWEEYIKWLIEQNTTIPNDFSNLEEYIKSLIELYSNSSTEDMQTVLLDGSITWKTGLTFFATDLFYKILGLNYRSLAQEITLSPADATYPRIDIFVVDRFGNLSVKTGQPSADPVKPTVNYDQLEVTQANIAAGATVPSNISTETVYDEEDPAEWTPTTSSDTHTSVTTSAITDPVNGTKHVNINIDVPDTEIDTPTHYIGEYYQGGKIFWIDPGGKSGLIAAVTDQGVERYERLKNNSPYTTGATGTAIGTGAANSVLLEAHLHNAATHAVKLCSDYSRDGYDDWFLPSRDELRVLYFRRNFIGGFQNVDYWSSSETHWDEAYSVRFSDGLVTDRDKDHIFRVRAVRAFDDSALETSFPVEKYSPIDTRLDFQRASSIGVLNAFLTFSLNSSLPWLPDSALLIESWNNGSKNGTAVLYPKNFFGFDATASGYQQVSIPLSAFGANVSEIDKFSFRLINTWPNGISLNIDLVRIISDTLSPAVPNDWIEFEFGDFEAGTAKTYVLNLRALVDYTITSLLLQTDDGVLSGIALKIDGVSVTGIENASADNSITEVQATALYFVEKGSKVELYLSPGYSGSPTIIRGQVNIIR